MSENQTTPLAHHPKGPSNFPAWAHCPCFEGEKDIEDLDIESLLPESKQLDATAKNRGTAQHESLAKVILQHPDPFAGLDEVEEAQVRWTASEVIQGAAAVGYDVAEISVEQRLTLYDGGFGVIFFGTADIEYGPFIDDAKFGDIRDYFAQMAGYALAKMERDELRRVTARLRYGRARRTIEHNITKETAERVVYGILAKVDDPNKRPKPCEYCGWCKKAATCEAINVVVDSVLAKRDDWGIRLPSARLSEIGSDPVLIGALRWIWKAYVEPWGAKLEYHSNIMASMGNVPLGFKKQPERGRLEFTSSAAVVDVLEKAGLPRESIIAAATFSMTALTEAYKAHFGGSKEKAAAALETLLVGAKVAARGDSTFKLIRQASAEDEIRAALARPATVLPLPEPKEAKNLKSEQGTTNTP